MSKARPTTAPGTKAAARAAAAAQATRIQTRRSLTRWVIGLAVAAALVGGLYAIFNRSTSTSAGGGSGRSAYQVGDPGVGAAAPGFRLAASTGQQVSLAGYRGKTVLLYFQEGLGCQPCWDQLTALEKQAGQVSAAGVDAVVSITSDPVDLITTKTHDMKISTPVLSDPGLTVSKTYHANQYGMMGTSRDGHTFILVGPDGTIRWRADYGGAPKYTMYVAPAQLLADLHAGTASQP
jgi:peroxiredoxin Q/BCP